MSETSSLSSHNKTHHRSAGISSPITTISVSALNPNGLRRDRALLGVPCAMCEEPMEYMFQGERVVEFGCAHAAHEACFRESIRFNLMNPSSTQSPSQKKQSANSLPRIRCPICDAVIQIDPVRYNSTLISAKKSIASLGLAAKKTQVSTETLASIHTKSDPAVVAQQPSFISSDQTDNGLVRLIEPLNLKQFSTLKPKSSFSSFTTALSNRSGNSKRDPPKEIFSISPETVPIENELVQNTVQENYHHPKQQQQQLQSSPFLPPTLSSPLVLNLSPVLPFSSTPSKLKIPDPKLTIIPSTPAIVRSLEEQGFSCVVRLEIPQGIPITIDPIDIRRRTLSKSRFQDFSSPDSVLDYLKSKLERFHRYKSLDIASLGKLRLWGRLGVGYMDAWQALDCYLFRDFLICVKEKNGNSQDLSSSPSQISPMDRLTIKSFLCLRKHLLNVIVNNDNNDYNLVLNLSVSELPQLLLTFRDEVEREKWRIALSNPDLAVSQSFKPTSNNDLNIMAHQEFRQRQSTSSVGTNDTTLVAPSTPISSGNSDFAPKLLNNSVAHMPLDIVIAIPISETMKDTKKSIMQDAIRFIVASVGPQDRIGIVAYTAHETFNLTGSDLKRKNWQSWRSVIDNLGPNNISTSRSNPLVGAKQALKILQSRSQNNPVSSIFLISDVSRSSARSSSDDSSHSDAIRDFTQDCVSWNVALHSFGIGMSHDPIDLVEISNGTKGTYTYIKDWMLVRDCLAGCLGLCFSMSHKDIHITLKIPEESASRICKIEGAASYVLKNGEREAEVSLGDGAYGDKRDIIVQLSIPPDVPRRQHQLQDPWDMMLSDLKAIGADDNDNDGGGSVSDRSVRSGSSMSTIDSPFADRTMSVQELVLLKAEISFMQFSTVNKRHKIRPGALLVVLMLHDQMKRKTSAASISHPSGTSHPILAMRRAELLVVESLKMALALVQRGRPDKASEVIRRSQKITQGLSLGALPIPPDSPASAKSYQSIASGVDPTVMAALNKEMQHIMESIHDREIFLLDTRNAVLQSIAVITSQRACTTRSLLERTYASRNDTVLLLEKNSREWGKLQPDSPPTK
ncbi:hypothetical protein V1514DRAFT_344442 [Lipomyces japonicus]|uniref:uncharacterized protein n=1 Tax=Lipomyces japonicus TaxID=56871 RepID=UPI0034CFEF59